MRYVQVISFLLVALLSTAAFAQDGSQPEEPVTRAEVRRWLTVTQDDPELSEAANRELIAEIEERGVNFALSRAEEWALGLLEASDELLGAIRNGLPAEKREALLRADMRDKLYATFMAGYNRGELTSRRSALDAGKEFLTLFASDPTLKDRCAFISRQLPSLERAVRMLERAPRTIRGRN